VPEKIDCLVHLAAHITQETASPKERKELFKTNLLGTWRALEYSMKVGLPRFIFASSMSVYGHPSNLPVTEDAALAPKSLYGASKASGEFLVQGFSGLLSGTYVILRFASIYGPEKRYGVTHEFINRALRGLPLILFNRGRNTSDFVYIEDVVRAIYLSAKSDCQGTYNIGSGEETSILQLAEAIQQMAPGEIAIKHSDEDEPEFRFVMDLTRAGRCLNYQPNYSLPEGLRAIFASQLGTSDLAS